MSKKLLNSRNINKINEKIKKLRFAVRESIDSDGEIRDLVAYDKLKQYLSVKKEILK